MTHGNAGKPTRGAWPWGAMLMEGLRALVPSVREILGTSRRSAGQCQEFGGFVAVIAGHADLRWD